MRKIIEYTLVVDFHESHEENFLVEVKKYIKEGWQPLGGVSTSIGINKETGEEYYMFSQAMVKYDSHE